MLISTTDGAAYSTVGVFPFMLMATTDGAAYSTVGVLPIYVNCCCRCCCLLYGWCIAPLC